MNFILIKAVGYFAYILELLIVIRVLFSFLPELRGGRIYGVLHSLTEPILGPIRSLLNRSPLGGSGMMLDFSPIVAYFFIEVAKSVIVSIIGMF